MKSSFLKVLGACAVAIAIATPAWAVPTLSLLTNNALKTLQVGFSGSTDPLTAYDLYISYDTLVPADIVGVTSNNLLGDTSVFDAMFLSDTSIAGVINGFENSFLTAADVAALQTPDPFYVFTVQFDNAVDLDTVSFALSTNGLSNAACDAARTGPYQCLPSQVNQTPDRKSVV